MNKVILILLSIVWLGVGCKAVKSWVGWGDKPHEELAVPPEPNEIKYDKDGNPIFTEDVLNGLEKPFNWGGALLVAGLFATTALIVRRIVKNKK